MAATTILWKSNKPVSITLEFCKLRRLFVRMRSVRIGFSGFWFSLLDNCKAKNYLSNWVTISFFLDLSSRKKVSIEEFSLVTSWEEMFPLTNNWIRGGSRYFLKDGTLYVGHHGCPTNKILAFRCSKKTKLTLKTIRFWRNISISIFKLSPFLYNESLSMESNQFFKLYRRFDKEIKKHSQNSQWEKKNWEKKRSLFYNRLFYKVL